ncbi:MAG: pacearchaeosortase [archaeon]|nr:pacearchaeosortase [archaeon]MCR4324001.1 pacearchaeosortase [Nanoarchaeota archaeon]
MVEQSKKIISVFARYVFILLMGLGNLYIFYKLLTPLTVNTVAFVLSFFKDVTVSGTFIVINRLTIVVVPACVAGAAFYLMFILVFSTAKIDPKKRVLMLVISFVVFFLLNVGRILILIVLIDKPYFNEVHWIFWNLISTLFVVGIWVGMVYLYKIKSIPVYSDLKYVWELVNKAK